MPFIAAAKRVELAGVVARAQAIFARVEADLPGIAVFPSLAATDAGFLITLRHEDALR